MTSALPETSRRARAGGLWRHRDFMRLWIGQTVSQLGSTISREALPYTAILALHASPLQMGLLGAAGTAPLLLLGLFAGVWADRVRRRPLMIAADLIRALLLLSIPLAYALGWLRIGQLYVVAALAGTLTVFFDVAYHALLPALVEREHLVEANSKLGISDALSEIGGPTLGGALVQLISGPLTLLLDALSFLFSAAMLLRIGAREPAPARPAEREHVGRDLAAGLRFVWASPLLRAIALSSAVRNFFGWFFGAIYGLYAIRVLGFGTATLGVVVACGGIGALLGALLAAPASRRLGVGPALLAALLVGTLGPGMIWLAGAAPALALPLMVASQIVGDAAMAIATINQLSLRQASAPDHMLGRVSASMQVLGEGVGTLGLLAGGALAELIGLHATAGVAALGIAAAALLALASPLRRQRELPA
ncbi:MFS transporter [Kouleothrix sp.]|uniref:MFS transporter n=1 Tax=Kouleothrix sp. TaxID=2779161 RepID=UPI003918B630